MPKEESAGRAALLLGLVVVLWGINWPIMKVGLHYMPPLWFALARVTLGALTLVLLLVARGDLRLPSRGDLPILLSVGVVQVGAFLALTHVALLYVDSGRSAILAYTTPLWVAPLSAFFLGERLAGLRLLAVGAGLAGVAVLFNPLAVNYRDHDVMLGNGLLMAAAFLWALTIVHVRGHRWQATALQLMPWQLMLGAVVLLPLALLIEPNPKVVWGWPLAAVLAYNGPVASAFCYSAFVAVNRVFSPTTTAVGSLGVPVVGVLAAAVALGEPLTVTKLAGLALIATGVVLLSIAATRGR
ncbi:MAG: DMT family transporter [Rhodospirillales bacterium]|nr:DMT family transporter [Rhodospirillales bacterium]